MIIKKKSLKFKYPKIKNGRFFNPQDTPIKNILYEYLILVSSIIHEIIIFFQSFKNGKNRFPNKLSNWVENEKEIAQTSLLPSIIWIGHATFLIQIGNINILTDPIFGNITFLFPRILPPSISLEKLPKIDYVLISHNHLDHMDSFSLNSLKNLNPNIKILVPQGNKNWFNKRGFKGTIESMWWNEHSFSTNSNQIKFTFLPSHHWSQRTPFDQNKSLWGSWMIEVNQFCIYFAGDTAYSEHFKEISSKFSNINVALMPIGPCEPRKKMVHSHVSAEEAIKAFQDLDAQHFVPMHWGTFHFGTDLFDTPIIRLKNWWQKNVDQLNFKTLNIVKFGQKLEFVYPEVKLTQKSIIKSLE